MEWKSDLIGLVRCLAVGAPLLHGFLTSLAVFSPSFWALLRLNVINIYSFLNKQTPNDFLFIQPTRLSYTRACGESVCSSRIVVFVVSSVEVATLWAR